MTGFLRAWASLGLLLAGCAGGSSSPPGGGELEVWPETQPAEASPEAGVPGDGAAGDAVEAGIEYPFDSPAQPPRLLGTTEPPTVAAGSAAMLLVNGRLSDGSASYAVNRIVKHHILGSAFFVYDPLQPGKVLELGRPDSGDLAMTAWTGPSPKDRQKLGVYEVAWSASLGLWGFSLETINDEWLLTRWNVDGFATGGLRFGADFWALPEETDTQNTLYWEDDIAALCFLDDVLWVGTSGDPKADNDQGGQLYALEIALPPTYRDLAAPNRNWYLDGAVPGPTLTLDDGIAFAGAMVCEGTTIRAIAHHYETTSGPLDVDFLLTIDLLTLSVTRAPNDIALTGERKDIEGLARIGGVLYGITVEGRVMRVDEVSGAAQVHDDLAPLFTDLPDQVRIRGATRIEIP